MDRQFERNLTDVIRRAGAGDATASNELFEQIYDHLRQQAQIMLRYQRKDASLWATGLVHDAYIRLFQSPKTEWDNRRHFLSVAAKAMRCVLVDHARKKQAAKRSINGDREPLDLLLDDFQTRLSKRALDLIALSEALDELEQKHPRIVQIVHLRFFLGMSEKKIADLLDVGERTVQRDWAYGRAWLAKRLR